MATRMKVRSIPEDSYYSKVVINGETVMDLTGDTVSAELMIKLVRLLRARVRSMLTPVMPMLRLPKS